METVKLRVVNGDGAQWIQKDNPKNSIAVLDAYHRNRAIGRFVKNAELAGRLRQLLYAGEIPALLERLETAVNETTEQQDKESLAKLLGYYTENKDSLTGYYERGLGNSADQSAGRHSSCPASEAWKAIFSPSLETG